MKPKDPEYIIPIDIGQAADFTAIGALRRIPVLTGKEKELYSGSSVEMTREYEDTFHLGFAQRMPLHTPYPDVIDRIVDITTKVPGTWRVVMDATGVGRPVVDMAHEAGLNPIGIIITAGAGAPRHDPTTNFWNVPKRVLVSTAQVFLQTNRFKMASKIPLVDTILKEMLAFKAKVSAAGHTSFEAWREGAHDDLVLMICMGLWWGTMTRSGWRKDQGPLTTFDREMREKARERFVIDDGDS